MGGEDDVWNNLSDSRNNNLSDKLSSMYYTCVSVSEPIWQEYLTPPTSKLSLPPLKRKISMSIKIIMQNPLFQVALMVAQVGLELCCSPLPTQPRQDGASSPLHMVRTREWEFISWEIFILGSFSGGGKRSIQANEIMYPLPFPNASQRCCSGLAVSSFRWSIWASLKVDGVLPNSPSFALDVSDQREIAVPMRYLGDQKSLRTWLHWGLCYLDIFLPLCGTHFPRSLCRHSRAEAVSTPHPSYCIFCTPRLSPHLPSSEHTDENLAAQSLSCLLLVPPPVPAVSAGMSLEDTSMQGDREVW